MSTTEDSESIQQPASPWPDDSLLDLTFLHARREAIVILLAWCVALVWSVGVCYWLGYGTGALPLQVVWGMPAWIFYGIGLPWAVAVVFSLWFCFGYMVDDDLSGPDDDLTGRFDDLEGHCDDLSGPDDDLQETSTHSRSETHNTGEVS